MYLTVHMLFLEKRSPGHSRHQHLRTPQWINRSRICRRGPSRLIGSTSRAPSSSMIIPQIAARQRMAKINRRWRRDRSLLIERKTPTWTTMIDPILRIASLAMMNAILATRQIDGKEASRDHSVPLPEITRLGGGKMSIHLSFSRHHLLHVTAVAVIRHFSSNDSHNCRHSNPRRSRPTRKHKTFMVVPWLTVKGNWRNLHN